MSSNNAPGAGTDRTQSRGGPPNGAVSIVLNGEPRSVDAGLTVASLLRQLALRSGTVVVERNRKILARDALEDVSVKEGDRIEIVHFVGGG